MNDWYEKEMDALYEAVNNGEISDAEYRAACRDLNDELRWQAEEAAEAARNEVLGCW